MKTITILLFCYLPVCLQAQTATFKWTDDFCSHTGTFDTLEYTVNVIKDCSYLLRRDSIMLNYLPVFYQPELIKTYSIEKLDIEYTTKRNRIQNLKLPEIEYWKSFRKDLISELDQFHEIAKLSYLSLENPGILKDFIHYDDCLDKHTRCLIAGGDSLLNDWFSLVLEHSNRNRFPDLLMEEYNRKSQSADKFFYARLYVTGFGWWNCANKYVKWSELSNSREREFTKLFLETKDNDCVDP